MSFYLIPQKKKVLPIAGYKKKEYVWPLFDISFKILKT